MTSATVPSTPTPPVSETPERVVVAVDPSNHSLGAALWASTDAARLALPLQIVSAAAYPSSSGMAESPDLDPVERERLESLAEELRQTSEVLPLELRSGLPAGVVLEHVDDHTRLLVLGHRDMGTARRVLTGSMSIAIAGRSPAPVVVVPDAWHPDHGSSAPVVVGVDVRPEHDAVAGDPEVLRAAFERAGELDAPLVALHAWEIPALLSWSTGDIRGFRDRVDEQFEAFLAPWRAEYPDVTVTTRVVAERPSDALTDASTVAQLVVVGRHTPSTRHGGFHLGSTARMVLHHLKGPVMVIPTPVPAGAVHHPEPLDTWGPMF